MRKSRYLLALTFLIVLAGFSATAASAQANATAVDVNVTFTRALIVIAGDPVQFGNVLINGNAGTVNLDTDTGTVTGSGGVISIDQATSQRGFISFVAPRPGTVGITYPANIDLLNANDSSSTVTFSPSTEVTSRVINHYSENVQVYVGGSLNFGVETVEGLYNGAVTISVDYV